MPTRLAVRVPRTFVDKTGKEQRRYTDAGTAAIPDDADRVDIAFHPGIVAATAIVMMPRGDDATLPLPEHARAERYDVTTSRESEDADGETVARHAAVGVLFRNRAGTGFNLRVNGNVSLTGRVVAIPAERAAPPADADAPPDAFDDDLAGRHGDARPPGPGGTARAAT